jgi:hypothetical protein
MSLAVLKIFGIAVMAIWAALFFYVMFSFDLSDPQRRKRR